MPQEIILEQKCIEFTRSCVMSSSRKGSLYGDKSMEKILESCDNEGNHPAIQVKTHNLVEAGQVIEVHYSSYPNLSRGSPIILYFQEYVKLGKPLKIKKEEKTTIRSLS